MEVEDGLKLKDERVLRSEFRLMDRKDKKLREGVDRDTKAVQKKINRIELVLEDGGDVNGGYYTKHILKENSRIGAKKILQNEADKSIQKCRSALKSQSWVNNVPHSNEVHLVKNQASDFISKNHDRTLNPRREVIFKNCNSHPNSKSYIQRILGSSRAFQTNSQLNSDKNIHAMVDGRIRTDKSVDRANVFGGVNSQADLHLHYTFGDNARPHFSSEAKKPSTYTETNTKRLQSGKALSSKSKGNFSRNRKAQNSREETEEKEELVDLAEFVDEGETQWLQSQSREVRTPNLGGTAQGSRPTTRQSQADLRPSASMWAGTSGFSSLQPVSKPVHPRQATYDNALRLREGKIFAKIDEELRIYDLRDLDCKMSIGTDIILKHRKPQAEGSSR